MKKVLVMAMAFGLIAAPVMAASIVGSKHDLSSSGSSAVKGNVDRICSYCHTPHGANAKAPLWNRSSDGTIDNATLYNSTTLTSVSKPTTISDLSGTDAPLCMSCHDGTIEGSYLNQVNGYAATDGSATISSGNALLGSDMSNDHPIGMDYSKAVGLDNNGLNTIANARTKGVAFYTKGGSKSDFMWCSSCHNVHDPGLTSAGTAPFLKISNAASGLCLACHAK